jgi:bifunctional non-homologous end joining protein LigD
MATRRTDGFIEPRIPTLAAKPPSGPGWVHEIKHDGYRLIVRRDDKAVRLFTRRGHDWTDRYPAIAAAAAKLRVRSFTIDGEAAVGGADGVAVFDALNRRHRASDAILCAFDLLVLNGEDLRPLPLSERKAKLAKLLARARAGLIFNEHTDEEGATVFRHACKMGLEGIVSKRLAMTSFAAFSSCPSLLDESTMVHPLRGFHHRVGAEGPKRGCRGLSLLFRSDVARTPLVLQARALANLMRATRSRPGALASRGCSLVLLL